jgi:hypothetical protein
VDQNEREFVERLLGEAIGGSVGIAATTDLGSDFAPVRRFLLDRYVPGLGRSVIVKTRRRGGAGWGYDPGNLRREYAGLVTLVDLGLDIAPQVVAADDRAGVLLLTDLGCGPTVEQLLMGDDGVQAENALLAAAKVLATMHQRAVVGESEFVARYSQLAGGETPDARPIPSLEEPLARWPQLRADFAEKGLPCPDLADDIATLAAMLSDSAARTFTHTDLTSHNFVVRDSRLFLVDFEGAGYRHVGWDLVFLGFPFQNHGLLIPGLVRKAMEQAYRAVSARTDERHAEAVALGCVLMLIVVCYSIRSADDAGQSAESARRRRARIWHLLAASRDALRRTEFLPAVARWLGDLADALYARWPEVRQPTPLFPVFR